MTNERELAAMQLRAARRNYREQQLALAAARVGLGQAIKRCKRAFDWSDQPQSTESIFHRRQAG